MPGHEYEVSWRSASGLQRFERDIHLRADLFQEIIDKERDIFRSFPERGKLDRHHVQPVKEVFPKFLLAHLFFQVLVGGRHDPDIHGDVLIAAGPGYLLFLQDPQDLGLQVEGHVADLVEKDGAAIGLFELAQLPFYRPGKGPLFKAEQLAFQEFLREWRRS